MSINNGLQKYSPYDRTNEIVTAEVKVETVSTIDQDLYKSLLTMPASLFSLVEDGRKLDGKSDPTDNGWELFKGYINRNRRGLGSAVHWPGLPEHRQVDFKELCRRVDTIDALIEKARAERLLNDLIRCLPSQEERILHPAKLAVVSKPKKTTQCSRWHYLLVAFGFKPKPE